jgi:non-heme chloroperoxidase
MNFITTKDSKTGEEIRIAYSDYGKGKPIVLIHGWPLSREMWEYQLNDLVEGGFRVVKYDRRGFGKSSKPWDGYDYDSLAADLHAVMEQLDLNDATLVGFSMGGGEVARYLHQYGDQRVSKAVLISSVLPYLLRTSDNPDGVDESVFTEMMEQMKEDRIKFLDEFGKMFFGVNLVNHPVSTPYLEYNRMLASLATARATQQCAIAFSRTDFRDDVKAIDVPTLIIHGDADKTVPIDASSDRTATMISNSQYLIYEGAPHGLYYTNRYQLNSDIINFINGSSKGYSVEVRTAETEVN